MHSASALRKVSITPGCASIGIAAFKDCRVLTTVTIRPACVSIDGWAFDICSRLPSMVLLPTVRSIGVCAFSCCFSLATIAIRKGSKKTTLCFVFDVERGVHLSAALLWDAFESSAIRYGSLSWLFGSRGTGA
jgi:hypothetical protein